MSTASAELGIAGKRCLNHGSREAVARCPECRRYFCRECITEHEGRVLCSACLVAKLAVAPARRRGQALFWGVVQVVAGLAALWVFFYVAGAAMLNLPHDFHEGAYWQGRAWVAPDDEP